MHEAENEAGVRWESSAVDYAEEDDAWERLAQVGVRQGTCPNLPTQREEAAEKEDVEAEEEEEVEAEECETSGLGQTSTSPSAIKARGSLVPIKKRRKSKKKLAREKTLPVILSWYPVSTMLELNLFYSIVYSFLFEYQHIN